MPPRERRLRLTAAQVSADLARRVGAGEWEPGAALPTYAQLADEYDVSVSTVNRAIAALRQRGVVVGVQGYGVFAPKD